MTTNTKKERPHIGWVAVVASFALIALTVVLFGMARSDARTSSSAPQSFDEVRLVEARWTLELAALDVVVLRMLDGVGVAEDHSDRLAIAAADVRSATAQIVELAEGVGPAAVEAEVLLAVIEIDALNDPVEMSMDELFEVAEDAIRYAARGDLVETRLEAIHQLGFVGALPAHVMIEGVAADSSVNGRAVDPSISSLLADMVEVVRTDGGWFGADPTAPLDDAIWIEVEDAWELLPDETARIEALVIGSPVLQYDAWMRDLGAGFAAAPFELGEALGEADQLQANVVAALDELIDSEIAEREAMRASQASNSRVLYGLMAAAGSLALVALLLGVRTISQATRLASERAAMASRDALTGVGNRHELEDRTRVLTADLRFAHHVVVMIDLDRFKMVNDLHGHAAGDAILVEVASRLRQVATETSGRNLGSEHSVVRLGGDEFLLTLHGVQAFDIDDIRRRLDAARGQIIEHEAEQISVEFSIGLVQVTTPTDLAELMASADFAVYEEKSTRSARRRPILGSFPPPQPGIDGPVRLPVVSTIRVSEPGGAPTSVS